MKDNFLQLTTCHSGVVYCRLIVIEKFIFYDEILSIAISCGKHLLDEIKKTSTLSSLTAHSQRSIYNLLVISNCTYLFFWFYLLSRVFHKLSRNRQETDMCRIEPSEGLRDSEYLIIENFFLALPIWNLIHITLYKLKDFYS